MKKSILIILISSLSIYFLQQRLVMEQDLIKSIHYQDEKQQRLFKSYHKSKFFFEKLFIDPSQLDTAEQTAIAAVLKKYHYEKVDNTPKSLAHLNSLRQWGLLLEPSDFNNQLSDEYVIQFSKKLLQTMSLPGSSHMVKHLLEDPFQIAILVANKLLPTFQKKSFDEKLDSKNNLQAFSRVQALNYEAVEAAYNYLESFNDRINFIAADFFSLSNYLAIKDDINFCIFLSLILNLLLFLYFSKRYQLLFVLAVGTLISYLSGLLLLSIFHAKIYSIVFAFTSTFIGFNNEYLIHLSGIKHQKWLPSVVGLGSAIGTTLIGFLVLLFADSVLVRQMAIVSIGGMIGFIGFMIWFQPYVDSIEFKPIAFRGISLSPTKTKVVFALCCLALALVPKPNISTQVSSFNYESEKILKRKNQFNEKFGTKIFENAYGIALNNDPMGTWQRVRKYINFHPIQFYKGKDHQEQMSKFLSSKMDQFFGKVRQYLKTKGVDLNTKNYLFKSFDLYAYLEQWNNMSPMPWYSKADGGYLVASLNKAQLKGLNQVVKTPAIPLSYKDHYNYLLSHMGQTMIQVLMIGLVIMFLYLLLWQKNLYRICYIFTPLIGSLLVICFVFYVRGTSLNFIHTMGLALVIALSLDYTAISISSNFSAIERSKVCLTGLSALISFGLLILAKHPVLNDLGLVVSIGSLTSLIFSLGVKTIETKES